MSTHRTVSKGFVLASILTSDRTLLLAALDITTRLLLDESNILLESTLGTNGRVFVANV
jgi:hypothetical protein